MRTLEMDSIEKYLDGWAQNLTISLIEIRHFETDRIKAALCANLKAAMLDCLAIKLGEKEKIINELKKKIANESIPYRERWKMMQEIGALKPETKQINYVLHTARKQSEYGKLKDWVVDNYGQDKLNEFLNSINQHSQNTRP